MKLHIAALLLSSNIAFADSEHVVLGPVAVDSGVSAKLVERVKTVLGKSNGITIGQKSIDSVCAVDAACLANAGGEAHAKMVVAITVRAAGKKEIGIELVLVDVSGKELIGRRSLTIADARLPAQLGPAITKFLDDGPTERAKSLFQQGNEHYNLGEYAQALEIYKRAYRVKPLPAFLFNVAQCHRKLNQHKDAIAMYQSYLVGVPNAPDRKMVEDLIAESQTKLTEELALANKREADEAKLEQDRIAAAAKANEDARRAKELEAQAATKRTEQARIEADREREREKLYDRHPARKLALIAGGVGVVTLATGGVFGLLSRSAQSAFDNAGCGDPERLLGDAELAQCQTDRDRGMRNATVGNILMIGGGVITAAAGIVFLLDPGNLDRPKDTGTRVTITPRSIDLVVRW